MGTEPTQDSGPGSIEVGDFKIQSGQASESELQEQFKEQIEEDTKAAASKLGKKGAKAKKEKQESEDQTQGSSEDERLVHTQEDEGSTPSPAPTEDEEAREAKAEEAEDSEDEDKSKDKKLGKPRNDPRARMLQATRQLAEERRAHKETREQIEELRASLEELKKGKSPNEPKAEPSNVPQKPDPAEFDDYETYLDARDEWNLKRWSSKAQEEAQRTAQMSAQDQALAGAIQQYRDKVGQKALEWAPHVKDLKAEFQLGPKETPSAENWIANELVFNPESAPALGLYLSEHTDEFQRIASLTTPRAVSRAMAKLEAKLEAVTTGTSPEPVQKSKAAPPVKPVQGSPYVSEGDPGPKPGEDFDAWLRRTKPKNPYS